MKIVVDLQTLQGTSKNRGIGRYSLSLALALARLCQSKHEIWIALNGLFPDTVEGLRRAFNGLIPPDHIVVWEAPCPVAACDSANSWRREAAELIRESFLAYLKPDIIYTVSLFEGFSDNCVTSIGKGSEVVPNAVTLYDLIPLIFEDLYLPDPQIKMWYYQKLQSLKNADLWLAISEHTRRDAVERLGLPEDRVVNVSAGCDPRFKMIEIEGANVEALRIRYGIKKPFIAYTGSVDPRKNLESLIQAFAQLPKHVKKEFQLLIIGDIQEYDKRRLLAFAKREGLKPDEIVFTGFVPDEDLVALYNLCALFVFPSLYEGFGLPPLEAMACGAPVIASNTSSLPEVVGWDKALFDPYNPEAIAEKMKEALTDEGFRKALRKHGLEQARKFSWEESARRALKAFEDFHAEKTKSSSFILPTFKPRLAYISPLPPVRTGVADYSRELLPELAKYYRIELIVDQTKVSDPWLSANFPIRSASWFAKHADQYDRILYHFGNSEFHKHMFGLLEKHPGVVVFHDFYLSNLLEWMDSTGYAPAIFRKELYRSHGWTALARLAEIGKEEVVWDYPCNLGVIQAANGVIVHSLYAMELAKHWYGESAADDWELIPLLRYVAPSPNRAKARQFLGFSDGCFLVCSFGFISVVKLPEIIIEGWLASKLARNPQCYLVFVGHCFDPAIKARLKNMAKQVGVFDRVRFTGYVSSEIYESYLAAADVGIQLRTKSRGETSRVALDALAWGIPLVVNKHGWFSELPDEVVVKLPEHVSPLDVANVLEKLYNDPELRRRLSEAGRAYVEEVCNPRKIAARYFNALETFAKTGRHWRRRRLIDDIARNARPAKIQDVDLVSTAAAIAANEKSESSNPQLLIDVSVIAQEDIKTGIQRVTRSHLKNLLYNPPTGWRTEPVSALPDLQYHYARTFTAKYLGLPHCQLSDEVVDVRPGDIFLGLDWAPNVVPGCIEFFVKARVRGAHVYFLVHDLIPVYHPEWFPPKVYPLFTSWLKAIVKVADGIVCVSRATANDLLLWLNEHKPKRLIPLRIGYAYNGADIENARPPDDRDVDPQISKLLAQSRPVVLMVGTIEPRKGYDQALEAFELLWQSGVDVSLVIAGKQGWMMEALVGKLRRHSELGKRLFWFEGVSDATLLALYRNASVLLMASRAEGFGLPLVEAARHGLPIIARDIPVFREICDEHAFYFKGNRPEDLAEAILTWLKLYEAGKAPFSCGIKILSWQESTHRLLDVILNGKWYKVWESS